MQQEQIKITKHADFYARIGFAFFPFVVSCFGSFRPIAVRGLFSMADLELCLHDSLRAKQGLDPLANVVVYNCDLGVVSLIDK